MTTQETKHIEKVVRETILSVAKQYTKESVEYLDKNNNVTNEQAIRMIANLHIKNAIIRDNFLRAVNKSISKL